MHFRPRCVCGLFTRFVWVDYTWTVDVVWVGLHADGWFRWGGLYVNGYFVCVGLRGKI